MGYITQAELESYLKRPLTPSEEVSFPILLASAQLTINNYTDTNFNDAQSTSRYFDGGVKEILIDPCNTVTEVALTDDDGSITNVYSENEYILEPVNESVKTSLVKRFGRFCNGIANVKVTAKFSSYIDKVPEDIKLATMILCSNSMQNPQNFKSESIEGYSYTMAENTTTDENIKNLLAPYRQILL